MSRDTKCEYDVNTSCTCLQCCKDAGLYPDCEYPTRECQCTETVQIDQTKEAILIENIEELKTLLTRAMILNGARFSSKFRHAAPKSPEGKIYAAMDTVELNSRANKGR